MGKTKGKGTKAKENPKSKGKRKVLAEGDDVASDDIVQVSKKRKINQSDSEDQKLKEETVKPTSQNKTIQRKKIQKKSNDRVTRTKLQQEKMGADEAEDLASKDEAAVARPSESNKDMLKYVGAHVSIAGGIWKAVDEAVAMGAKSFALFLKSQRQWVSKPLKDEDAEKFKKACQEHGFSPRYILPHGSYLMNCGSPKQDVLQKSRDMLVEELQRCEKLGLTLFNFHPGSTCGEISTEESISRIADSINNALSKTEFVIAVIENMCCQGNTIGGRFEELGAIIEKINNKSRIGVCLDTCHAFAAGYEISTKVGYEKMMIDFDKLIGLKYLKALHVNDSKGEVGCHLDRHENIGKGKIGLDGFRRMMNDPRLNNLPLVLETPLGDYAREIKKLYSLCNPTT